MANVLQSKVTINDSWLTDGNTGKKFSARNVTVILATQGGTTNKLLASVLALTKIVDCSPVTASDNSIYTAAPSYDGTFLVFSGGDISKTVNFTVKGNP